MIRVCELSDCAGIVDGLESSGVDGGEPGHQRGQERVPLLQQNILSSSGTGLDGNNRKYWHLPIVVVHMHIMETRV